MSAIVCCNDANGVAMLTDGASYDENGVIVKVSRKVTIGKVAPIAVATRGNAYTGEKHQQMICDLADKIGVDAAIRTFGDAVASLSDMPYENEGGMLQWHIAAWSQTKGPVQFSAHNIKGGFSNGEQPFRLHQPNGIYYSNNMNVPGGDLAAVGIRPRFPTETVGEWLEAIGGPMMEAMRRHAAPLLDGQTDDGTPKYLVGGHCDLTIVTESSATVKTLKTWPDRVGEKINPFAETANVVSMLNRKQRRAMEREQARRAKRAIGSAQFR